MIERMVVYGHDGYLVRQEGGNYGVFSYHDVGSTPTYGSWNKLTHVGVVYVKKTNNWIFKFNKRASTKLVRQETIGIKIPEFIDDWIKVVNMLYAEIKGRPIPTEKELKKIGEKELAEQDAVRIETEEEILLKQLTSKRRQP